MDQPNRHQGPAWTARLLLIGTSLGFLLLSAPAILATVERSNPAQPNVTDGRITLNIDDLSHAQSPFLTGMHNNSVLVSYEGTEHEILDCSNGYLQFTLNGTSPKLSELRSPLTCSSPGGTPGLSQTFQGVVPGALMRAEGPNATVAFQVVIALLPGGTAIDDNRGFFYRYRVDNTAPVVKNWTPASPEGTEHPWGASQTSRPAVSFTVQDDERQARLGPVQVTIDGINATDRFSCDATGGQRIHCALDYARTPTDFAFAAGSHAIQVQAGDETGNPAQASSFRLIIDRDPPVISHIAVRPGQFAFHAGRATTARGVNLTVTAQINDTSLDPNDTSAVFAQAFSPTLGLQSPLEPMRWNPAAAVWQTTDLVVPLDWPSEAEDVDARILASDHANNVAFVEATDQTLALDPNPPLLIVDDEFAASGDRGTVVHVRALDDETGVDPASVHVEYANETGRFKDDAGAMGGTRLAPAERVGDDGSFQALLPPAEDGSLISYSFVARDRAGGESRSGLAFVDVDGTAPMLRELGGHAFRAGPPFDFIVSASDNGSGLDPSNVQLHYAMDGAYASVPLTVRPDGTFGVRLSNRLPEGGTLRYYFDAKDRVGNVGRLGTPAAPLRSRIDLTPPTFAIHAPASADGPFQLTWDAADTASGIQGYRIEARQVDDEGQSAGWFPLVDGGVITSLPVCVAGPADVEFRGNATDGAGNARPVPAAAQAVTRVEGTGCPERIHVDGVRVAPSPVIDATRTKTATITWTATTSIGQTPSSALKIRILFSPNAGGEYFELASGLPNTGRFSFVPGALESCAACEVQVQAVGMTGARAVERSAPFEIRHGDANLDRDGNGLPDGWELKYANRTGVLEASVDDDHDGLTNVEEAEKGTDPLSSDTDGDGVADSHELQLGTDPLQASSVPDSEQLLRVQPSLAFVAVPAAFVVNILIFLFGLARKW